MTIKYTWMTSPHYYSDNEPSKRPMVCYDNGKGESTSTEYVFDLYDTVEEAVRAYLESDINDELILTTIYKK